MVRKPDDRKGDRHVSDRTAYMREYMRARRGSTNRANMPFVGIDGEGGGEQGDKHPGYHAYFLLRAGEKSIRPDGDNVRITTGQALEFISGLDPHATYVGYFFDYDVTKILEDLPWTKLERLMNRNARRRSDGHGIFPVDYGPFELDYLPRKEFKVRKGKGPWIVINDVGSFFQCRFVQALEAWQIGSDDERRIIATGKDMRGNFEVSDIEMIDRYNAMEIKLLQELMEKFRSACYDVDLRPSKWQGPGLLAKSMLASNGVAKTKDVPLLNDAAYDGLLTFGRSAFYGGRPELAVVGPVERPVFQYDINSAYPAAMLDVPCLMHGGWEFEEYVGGMPATAICADSAIVFGKFEISNVRRQNADRYAKGGNSKTPLWFGLPFRSPDGSICYPAAGRGWYWDFEIRSAIHQDFIADSAWVYNRQCDCKPLAFIEDMYQKRLALGKNGPGTVLKLAINSVYGVCVQSIGKPEYANSVWGSYITARCRAQIQDFIHSSPSCTQGSCGSDILMVATDSVATWRQRKDIPLSKELGEWDEEVHPKGMFLIQPGLYFGSSGKHAKTRGVPLAVIEEKEAEFRAAFRAMVETQRLDAGDVSVPQHMFVGIRYALHRHNAKLLGQWIRLGDNKDDDGGKKIKFDWTTKRLAFPILPPTVGRSYVQTFPQPGDPGAVTLPYSKDIGGLLLRDVERAILEAAPDWVPMVEPGEMS